MANNQTNSAFHRTDLQLRYGTHTALPNLKPQHLHEHTEEINTNVDATANTLDDDLSKACITIRHITSH